MVTINTIKLLEYIDDSEKEKFWKKVDASQGPMGCWLWTGATKDKTQENSYGVINLGHKTTNQRATILAHRLSWAIANQREPSATIDHLCFKRNCVNPAHLRDISWSQNSSIHEQQFLPHCSNGHYKTESNTKINQYNYTICLDCRRELDRGRYKEKYAKEKLKYSHSSTMKDYNAEPKLTWEQVCEIREKYKLDEYSQSKLAIEYNVSKTNISLIVNNKTRKIK